MNHKFRYKSMKPQDLLLRGYAKIEPDGSWYAVCLDLNLFAEGDTSHQAQEKLHKMIEEYVQEAFTTDSQYFSDLIPRRAPVYFFLYYYYAVISHKIKKTFDGSRIYAFTDHLPLEPSQQHKSIHPHSGFAKGV